MLGTVHQQKFSKLVSKKLEFGHLSVKGENDDDDPRAEKFFWRWCQFARFSHVGVRGVWLNVQREFRPGKKFPQVFPKSLIFAIYRR